ncbi:MAG: hypothetical protein LBR20_02630 [Propionibacteriaceae bacterium]|jgi:hypothetical protein|nr:hypothetical protein [Propionibacteriaceae bacterium]
MALITLTIVGLWATTGCAFLSEAPPEASSPAVTATPSEFYIAESPDVFPTHFGCYDLLDYPQLPPTATGGGDINISNLGTKIATYHHQEGTPYEPPSQAQAVDAGSGYWVIAAVAYGETTTWLAWGNNPDPDIVFDEPYGNWAHFAEITDPENWDGGEARYGVEALQKALACIK